MIEYARKTTSEVYVNCRIEQFPGYKRIAVASHPIFKPDGWEAAEAPARFRAAKGEQTECSPEQRSVNRAKKKVHDIAALNDFDYFITWTLDKQLIARTEADIVSTKLKTFLGNKVKRNNMSYLVIPELHKDGLGIHMHGLVSGSFTLNDSGRKTANGRKIWNMTDWPYGFSTCIEQDGNRERTANYIAKYLSKDFRKIFGNFYYAGGNITRYPPTSYTNMDYDQVNAPPYQVPNSGVSIKYLIIREERAA